MSDEVRITATEDGPLIVQGDAQIVDEHGCDLREGRRSVALCRCGRSGKKPFCDGTHAEIDFKARAAE